MQDENSKFRLNGADPSPHLIIAVLGLGIVIMGCFVYFALM